MKPALAFRLGSLVMVFFSVGATKPSIAATRADTFTAIISEPGVTVKASNPCLGSFTAVLSYDGVIHVTETDGSYHTVAAIHGSATTIPGPGTDAFTGGFSEVETLNLNPNTTETTFLVTQRGTQGLVFHIMFHLTMDSAGTVKADVLNFACGE